MTAVTCPKCSHTFAVELPSTPTGPMGPRGGKLVTFAAPTRALPAGVVTTFGAPVEAFAKGEAAGSLDDPAGVWMVLAYAVSMKGSDVTLSKEDFEAAVANHKRYPCSPVVIEHADTDWWNNCPAWAEPHGHVEELRVGEAEVEEMDGTTRTAATLEGRVTFLDATRAEVKARKWRFVSITLAKGMKDEATDAAIGALLWSLSLTAHPRLTGLDPIPASLRERLDALSPTARAALLATLGAPPPAPPSPTPPAPSAPLTPTETSRTMKTFLEHAHALGLTASSEDDARDKVLAFAAQQAQTLKLLGLTPAAPPTELASKIGDLQATAGRVPALEQKLATQETELGAHRTDKSARDKAELDQHIAELFVVHPELKVAEEAVRYQAEHDRAAFAKKYPRPTPEELVQAAQHPARLAHLVPPAQRPAAPGTFTLPLTPQGGQGVPPQVAAQGAPVAVDAGSLVASLAATAQAAAGQPVTIGQLLRG